ncbi:hypothetical protein C8Q79DRAFT_1008632 [Trametes meyenii]|nr:hypothetical protein C8Q79DRAFT_1008632 [Trametes meyenii]
MKTWVESTHAYPFPYIVSSLVLLNGGIKTNFASPRVLLFYMGFGQTALDNDNESPARRFQILDIAIEDKSALGALMSTESWEAAEDRCRRVTNLFHVEPQDPAFCGVLPAIFILVNTGIVLHHCFPVFGPQQSDVALDERSRGVLTNVQRICIKIMNFGFILRAPDDQYQPEPDVGTLFKRGTKWEWLQLKKWRWPPCDEPECDIENPHMMWVQFHALTG